MARFATVSDEQLRQIITDKDANETKKQTEISWNILLNYCREKSLSFDPNTITKENLDKLLGKFYAEVRKQNGEMYKKTSFNCIRYSIQRKMKSFRDHVDTICNPEFRKFNEIFKAQCVQLKKAGLCQVNHHSPISREDLSLLYSSDVFSIHNPNSLQKKVFFDIMLHFCRRGGENLRKLTKAHFVIKEENGLKFVEKNKDELTKNHRENHTNQDSAVMIATGNENCPVASFIKYISLLNPKLDAFFQRPKKGAPNAGYWYDNTVLGEKPLLQMMKQISKDAHLSTIYTNHSIRATTVTILDENDVASRHIMSVSGHRSESSIRSYSKTNKDMKRKMSSILSEATHTSSHPKKNAVDPTVYSLSSDHVEFVTSPSISSVNLDFVGHRVSSSSSENFIVRPTEVPTKIKICRAAPSVSTSNTQQQQWNQFPQELLNRRCFDFGLNFLEEEQPACSSRSNDDVPQNAFLRALESASSSKTINPTFNFFKCKFK